MQVQDLSIAAAVAALAISLAACGSARGPDPQPNSAPTAPAARRAASVTSAGARTVVLAAGWMPSGRGFAITARRYAWRGHSYVALTASVVGHAKTLAAIRRQAASGAYGSTQSNIDKPSAWFIPEGLVDCAAHPAVLLFGWTTPTVRASLRQDGSSHALAAAIPPAGLGLPPGVLLYGSQTNAATVTQPGAASVPLGPPPRRHACRGGTEGITYGSPAGAARSVSGSG
jgi:hypothetical protein